MTKTIAISKRVVDGLVSDAIVWDSKVQGFGVRCQTRRKVYILKARIHGRQRWITIGNHGAPWTPETARREAQRLWGEIRNGKDPAQTRDGRKTRLRMRDLGERFLNDYARHHKKPSSFRMDGRNLANHINPLLGNRFADEITGVDIEKFKIDIRSGRIASGCRERYRGGGVVIGGPGAANRCLALLSKMFNLAERWGIRPLNSNPVRHVDRFPEKSIERYLSVEEFSRLAEVLSARAAAGLEDPFVVAAVRLLALTGARLGEVLGLRWQYIDFDQRMMRLPDSKTGKKVIHLSASAIEVLRCLPRLATNPFVIAGREPGQPLKNLQKPWGRIRSQAGLGDVRLHDLRHSFASVAAAEGLSLPIIGKLLGHTKAATTERYAHLASAPLKAANEAVAEKIALLMRSAEVVRNQTGGETGKTP